MVGSVALIASQKTIMSRKGVAQVICGARTFASTAQDHGSVGRSLGPAARNLVEHYRIQTGQLHPTGPKGFMLKGDVLKFIKEQNLKPSILSATLPAKAAAKPAVPAEEKSSAKTAAPTSKPGPKDNRGRIKYHDFPVSPEVRHNAEVMLDGKNSIPHAYTSVNCSIDEAARLFIVKGLKSITMTDVLVQIIAKCGQRVKVAVDGQDPVAGTNIDVAVRIHSEDKSSCRVLKNANRMGIKDVAKHLKMHVYEVEVAELATVPCRVVSLFGSHLDSMVEILSPNQHWVVTIGDAVSRFDAKTKASARTVILTLSYNAAVISEDEALRFLGDCKQSIERPFMVIAGLSGGLRRSEDV